MVNPDNLALKIAELADSGKVQGIADVRDDSSGRTGQRLVVVLKRDAVARVVLNNLLKHTELQTNFSANMLALVDYVPRTLTIDQFISNWVTHQIEVIRGAPATGCARPRSDAHILRGLVKALDALDEVIALIRRSPDVDDARQGLMDAARDRRAPGDRDPRHAAAPARRAASGRRSSTTSPTIELEIADLEDILANDARQRHDRRPRSSPRSSTSTATTGAPRSSRPTATCRWRT